MTKAIRRQTREVMVGNVGVGGTNPIRLQSMTTTDTMDTIKTVEQVLRLADVGCEIARITAPTVLDAQNLEKIKAELLKRGCKIPLVADIHFRPDAAMVAADFVEKVRINPGNFVDGKAFKVREYSDAEYGDELKRIEDKFTPLVLKMKKLKRAMRIGTNHGSLSDRIMNRYGDTPEGMVESALEYARICEKNKYFDIIFSMKASNPRIMIAAYRLLVKRMDAENMHYPLHLGVTEAGDGEDGRIKSAVGIGSLLEDGIGDTIRVSLTEDPEFEIPVCKEIARRYATPGTMKTALEITGGTISRRETEPLMFGPHLVGGASPIRVVSHFNLKTAGAGEVMDLLEDRLKQDTPPEILEIPYEGFDFNEVFGAFHVALRKETSRLAFWVSFKTAQVPLALSINPDAYVYRIGPRALKDDVERLVPLCKRNNTPIVLKAESVEALMPVAERFVKEGISLLVGLEGAEATSSVHATRRLIDELKKRNLKTPILLSGASKQTTLDDAVVMGALICDGIGDAISVSDDIVSRTQLDFSYNLLQACGSRITKTEYVSCPSCGRTLFDLQSTTERIKSKTGHLKGVKIAIMGCIVNGPGEMADADFGYVGGGPGKINLYVGKTCVEKSIPSDVADERLIQLIKTHGKWTQPPVLVGK